MSINAAFSDSSSATGTKNTPAADKNVRRIDPLFVTDIYYSYFDKGQTKSVVAYEDGSSQTFELLKKYVDKDTGFVAASFINRQDGHAILVYKGMDVPFKDEGGGHFRFLKDIWTIAQSHVTGTSAQQKKAEEAYFDTMNNPAVKDMEIGGFSMGTMFTNYVAAKHDAKGTVFADLGIADRTLSRLFNQRAQNQPAAVSSAYGLDQMIQKMHDNVVVLKMKGDILPRMFGVGPSRGRIVDLDPGPKIDPEGIEHNVGVYMDRASIVEVADRKRAGQSLPQTSFKPVLA